jgi:hypothetical protein
VICPVPFPPFDPFDEEKGKEKVQAKRRKAGRISKKRI